MFASNLLLWASLSYAYPSSPDRHAGFVEFDLHRSPKGSQDSIKAFANEHGLVEAKLANKQFYYQIQLGIGNPPQVLDFTIDTGSSDLWVMDSNNPWCTNNPFNSTGINCTGSVFYTDRSRTFNPLSKPFDIEYGDSTMANGTLATDTVRIGDTAVLNATFGLANKVNSTTCVFGVGFLGNEAEAHIHRNGSGVYPTYFNIPTLMKQQSLIYTNAYSLYLNDIHAETGSILFGGVDKAKYEGDLFVMPMYNEYYNYTDHPFQTRVMLNGIKADQKPLIDFDIAVLLDSGTSFSYLPKEVMETVGNALGFIYDDDVGYFFGSAKQAKSNVGHLNLNFSGAIINVSVEDLLVGLTLSDGVTPLLIDGEPQSILAVGPAEDEYMYILGDVFLRSMYAVFDLDHYEIALANAKLNATSADIRTIGASIPGATQAPNYFSTTVRNSSFNIHSFTPKTPPPSTLTVDLGQLTLTAEPSLLSQPGNASVMPTSAAATTHLSARTTSSSAAASHQLARPSNNTGWLEHERSSATKETPPYGAESTHPRDFTWSTPTQQPELAYPPEEWVVAPDGELMPLSQYHRVYGSRTRTGKKTQPKDNGKCQGERSDCQGGSIFKHIFKGFHRN